MAKGAILKKLSNLEKKIAKVLANFKLIAKNQMRWQRGLLANGDFDALWPSFQKNWGKIQMKWQRGLLENGDFDEYGEFGENGEFGKNRDYNMEKKTIDDGRSFDLQTNSLNQFSKEKYGDQSKEFVSGIGA